MAENKGPSFPEGTFRALADWQSVSMGTAEDGQNEQISVRLRVSENDPHDSAVGMSILWFGNFSNQKAIEITTNALKAMGWDGTSPIGEPDGKNGCLTGLGGTEVEMVVRHDEYNGKVSAKVRFVNAIAGKFGFKRPLAAGQLDKLNERVMRHLGATAPRQAARAESTSAHRPQHRRYDVDPKAPPTAAIGPRASAPLATEQARPVSDEDRLRAIDRGEDTKPPPDEDGGGYGGGSDDDIPF